MIALNEEEKCLSLVGTGNWKAGDLDGRAIERAKVAGSINSDY